MASELIPSSGQSRQEAFDNLRILWKTKQYQEEEALREIKVHNGRDRLIRKAVKRMGDYFRGVENGYRSGDRLNGPYRGWNSLPGHACMTQQDDVTKVDLPYFVVSASTDITRWSFDVNAHGAITNNAVVFSHEQGTGPKNISKIIEEILSEHILSCRGESVETVVSNNASVDKNWLCTVVLPQYIVDQGFADAALIIFLRNNHGKWLADMLFGQLQSRRKRSTLVSVDYLLTEFESLHRKTGKVRDFGVNPLSAIDFAEVLNSLGVRDETSKGVWIFETENTFRGGMRPWREATPPG